MIKAPATIAATSIGKGGCKSNQTPSGKVAAPTIEPMEIWRVQATVTTNTTATAATAHGVRHKKAPTKLATALPPWNLRNTGKACPDITVSAATLIHQGLCSVSCPAIQTARYPLAISS